jgi:hypothetical protein
MPAVPAEERPVDPTPLHTADLPATPVRDRTIPAEAWIEAPESVRRAGDDIGRPAVTYKRRIGGWLLWRAGPASRAHARYVAVAAHDTAQHYVFRLHPDGTGEGHGPSGTRHERFREWKEDLRDHAPESPPGP